MVNSYVGSRTLTQLQIDDYENKLRLSLENFPSLKSLKLVRLRENIFSTSECLPLEHLSINEVFAPHITFEAFTGFLKKFAPTLVHLEIKNCSLNFLDTTSFDFGRKVTETFPKLKFFSWDYPFDQETMHALTLYFLPRFPALEKLELTEFQFPAGMYYFGKGLDNNDSFREVFNKIADFLDSENYFGICLKLQSVHVFQRCRSDEEHVYVGYRKHKD